MTLTITVIALAIATGLIFLLSGEGGFFWQRYSIKTVFPDVAGLKPGAPVRVAGVEVGSVTAVDFVGDRVEVVMQVGRDRQPLITDRSTAVLGSVSLLGEAAVDITASRAGTPIPEWGYVPLGKAAGSIAGVATQATEGLDQATKLIADLRGGNGTAGKLLTDDTLYNELNRFLVAAETVTANINKGRGTLGRLMTNDATAKSLEASLKNLEAVTAKVAAELAKHPAAHPDIVVTSAEKGTGVPELRTARVEGDTLVLGACVTHADIEDGRVPDLTGGALAASFAGQNIGLFMTSENSTFAGDFNRCTVSIRPLNVSRDMTTASGASRLVITV